MTPRCPAVYTSGGKTDSFLDKRLGTHTRGGGGGVYQLNPLAEFLGGSYNAAFISDHAYCTSCCAEKAGRKDGGGGVKEKGGTS